MLVRCITMLFLNAGCLAKVPAHTHINRFFLWKIDIGQTMVQSQKPTALSLESWALSIEPWSLSLLNSWIPQFLRSSNPQFLNSSSPQFLNAAAPQFLSPQAFLPLARWTFSAAQLWSTIIKLPHRRREVHVGFELGARSATLAVAIMAHSGAVFQCPLLGIKRMPSP